MEDGLGDRAAPHGLRLIAGSDAPVDENWIWDSLEARKAQVQHLRNKTGELIAAPGIRRLQSAFLLAISADHFYVERRRITTRDEDWFQVLLERFVGQDRTARTGKMARGEWAAVTAVILGLVAYGEERRFGQPKVSSPLKQCLGSGDVGQVSRWAEQLGEDDLARIAHSTYLWLPSLLGSMASHAEVFGARKGMEWESFYTWTSGAIVIPPAISLGMRWFEDKFEFDYVDEMEFEGDQFDCLGRLELCRTNFEDEDVEVLVEQMPEPWRTFRLSETATHVSELVKVTSAEWEVAIAVAALDITWETAVDPNVLPNPDALTLYPGRFATDFANAEQKVCVNLRHVWWHEDLEHQEGMDDETGLRLLGLAIGKQLGEWMKDYMALRVKPSAPVTVHITPEPGVGDWDALMWMLSDEIPRGDLFEGSPDSPCLNVTVRRVAANSNDVAYPLLGSVVLSGEDERAWEVIRQAAYHVGQYGEARRPIVMSVQNGELSMCSGFDSDGHDVWLGEEVESPEVRSKFAASIRLLRSKSTLKALMEVAAKAGVPTDNFVLWFAWGFFSMDCLFDGDVWEDREVWPDVYLDPVGATVCSFVVLEKERNQWLDEHGAVREEMLEMFWSRAFPEELRDVVSAQDW